jgi:hypothetical protein
MFAGATTPLWGAGAIASATTPPLGALGSAGATGPPGFTMFPVFFVKLSSCASNGCADPATKTSGAATETIITASHFFIE